MKGCLLCNFSSSLNDYFGKGPFFSIRFPRRMFGNVLSGLWGALALSELLLGREEKQQWFELLEMLPALLASGELLALPIIGVWSAQWIVLQGSKLDNTFSLSI